VAEGRLDAAADVFMLGREELRAALAEPWGERLQERAAPRAEERERARRTAPAPFLGAPPDPDAEVPAMVAKFYGVAGSARRDGDVLTGTAASPGQATGIARVVRGPEDFARVSAREVLVCTTTTPAWTPLFPSLAGLVTDSGGILSHAAVVAREYALPAVVGAEVATTVVPDGALVSVDGSTGEVRILAADAARRGT
jgi:pyruvate,water dikinase